MRLAQAALGKGRGVLFAGPAGVGRTRLVRSSLERAEGLGYSVVELVAARSVSSVPYGAFLGLLGADPGDLADVPGRLYHSVLGDSGSGGAGRVMFGVDDAHLLDEESADLLHRLAVSEKAGVVASVLTGAAVPAAVSRLWMEGLVERVEVAPFDEDGTGAVLRAALQADVDADSVSRLHAVTRGNALLLRELVRHARSEGSLRFTRGAWHWSRLSGATGRLAELTRSQFGELSAEEHELVALLALAEPVPADLSLVTELTGAAERLNQRGILAVEKAGTRLWLRLAYPLHSAVIAATTPELTARRLRLRLADAIEQSGPRTADDLSRVAQLRLDAGEFLPTAELLAAALEAERSRDLPLAQRLCLLLKARPDAVQHEPACSLLLARLLAERERYEQAQAALAAADDDRLPSAARAGLAIQRSQYLAEGLCRADDADAVLAGMLETLPADQAPALHRARAQVWTLAGRVREVASEGGRILPDEPADSSLTQALVPSVAMAHTELGDAAGALELLRTCQPAVASWDVKPWLDHHVVTAISMLMMGRIADVSRVLVDLCERSEREGLTAGLAQAALLQAQMSRYCGRFTEAARLLRRAHDLERGTSLTSTRALTLARLAGVLAEAGEHSEALRIFAEAETQCRSTVPFPFSVDGVNLEAVVVHAHIGDVRGAVREALDLASRCAASGWVSREVQALHLAARLGETTAAARIVKLAPLLTSALLRAQAAHIDALARGDGDALLVSCERFRGFGMIPLAAETAAQAAVAYRRHGRSRGAQTADELSRELLASYGGTLPGWLTAEGSGPVPGRRAGDPAPDLTGREREIAALAAVGQPNRAIADRLGVSVRTVENHLQRVYTKLGIGSRADLAETLV